MIFTSRRAAIGYTRIGTPAYAPANETGWMPKGSSLIRREPESYSAQHKNRAPSRGAAAQAGKNGAAVRPGLPARYQTHALVERPINKMSHSGKVRNDPCNFHLVGWRGYPVDKMSPITSRLAVLT